MDQRPEVPSEESLKQDFLSLISHKLRTPVAVIKLSASLLAEGGGQALSDDQRRLIDGIVSHAEELRWLIEKLLVFTTIQRVGPNPSFHAINMSEYLPKALKLLVERFSSKPVDLIFGQVDENIRLAIREVYLDLILRNLFDNAVKFSDKLRVELRVSLIREASRACLTFADNGPGIPLQEHGHIFEKFYQIEESFAGNVEGFGLGLALIKRLVTAHGGEIRLRSDSGQGAHFSIWLLVEK
jgi:signal transduction histidine kinase